MGVGWAASVAMCEGSCARRLTHRRGAWQVVIMYRPKIRDTLRPADLQHLTRTEIDEHRVRSRGLYIKSFENVPLADLEIVFPEKRIQMGMLDRLKLAVAIVVGAGTLAYKMFASTAVQLNENVIMGLLVMLASYVVKIVVQLREQRDKYNLMITEAIYKKSLDNHDGVLMYLAESVLEQELKETLLAYFLLCVDGPMSKAELDAKCEAFLSDLGYPVDFEVDDALEKLERDRLAYVKDGRYVAVPMDRAIAQLDREWQSLFTDPLQLCPYCPYLPDESHVA